MIETDERPGVETASTESTSELQELAKLVGDQAQKVLRKVPLLGPIAWLMLQQPSTRYQLLSDLESRIMPALILDQSKLYMRDEIPIGYMSWAKLSNDVAQRYQQKPHLIAPSEWNSGNEIWIIDLIAPFGGGQPMVQELKRLFSDVEIKQLVYVDQKVEIIRH